MVPVGGSRCYWDSADSSLSQSIPAAPCPVLVLGVSLCQLAPSSSPTSSLPTTTLRPGIALMNSCQVRVYPGVPWTFGPILDTWVTVPDAWVPSLLARVSDAVGMITSLDICVLGPYGGFPPHSFSPSRAVPGARGTLASAGTFRLRGPILPG